MIITIAGYKGGVGKTTTAIHLAAYLQSLADTILIDGDANRSALAWAARGALPFKVVDEKQAVKQARGYMHVVIDTEARPEPDALKDLAEGCDLLVIPTTPSALALNALMQTIQGLKSIRAQNYKILMTMIPPPPSRDGEDARISLSDLGLPLFQGSIPRLIAFEKAALAGVIVSQVDDRRATSAWESYRVIGEELDV